MFTRGRLVPRQPRAIKGTTRTELRSESIHSGRYIHWNINITPTVLHCYNIRNGRCVHWNTGITPTALRGENIHGDRFVHWNTGITPTALRGENIHGGRFVHWNTGTTPTALHHERIHCDRRIHRNIGTMLITLHGCNIQMMRCFLLFYVQSLHKTADDFRLSGVFSKVFGELTCVIIVGPTLCYFRCNKFNDNIHWLNTFEIISEMSTYSE